ncbi:hypothetical protein [Bacillus sp. FJAT-22090]|uniref:hypothetical protein n=1 Tax=Bacillus sp. FJAT-22090 TaxID=1581038 RepID=UPI0011AA4F8D|nr:hypothetical protein [Bacillus sp. FJAT-22090]
MSEIKKDDDTLDELLTNMPKFTDQRSKEEIYNRVKVEVEAQIKEEKRKASAVSFSKWMPFIVSVASILLLTFLVSSYIDQKETAISTESEADQASPTAKMRSMDEAKESEETSLVEEGDQASEMTTMSAMIDTSIELLPLHKTTSVYADTVNEGTVFHFSLVENALTIPVTIIIPKEKIEADFPGITPTSLQLYDRYAGQIDEESLGFMEYHPYKGYFIAEDKLLKHYLPKDHGYDMASGASTTYRQSINEIFTDFETFLAVNEDSSPIEWDQVGLWEKPSKLDGKLGHTNYYNYHANNGENYLAPNFGNSYNSISEAFLAMKTEDNDIYTSVIPSSVTYSYKEEKGVAVIQFDDTLDLTKLEPLAATRLIEAFSLTGASFKTKVKLENVAQQEWAEFDLTKPLPVPLGPNGFIMNN